MHREWVPDSRWPQSCYATIIQFQHGSLRYKHRTDVAKMFLREPWVVFFFFRRSRGQVFHEQKITNAAAVLAVGCMSYFRYCGSEHNLEPTGVQMASNHLCKIVLRKVDVARTKPENGRFGKGEPDLPHATQRANASKETRKMDVDDGFWALLEKFMEHHDKESKSISKLEYPGYICKTIRSKLISFEFSS